MKQIISRAIPSPELPALVFGVIDSSMKGEARAPRPSYCILYDPPMVDRPVRRILFLGWDAADWLIIDRRFKAGGMPHLRALVERGVRADLTTLEPKLSPLLWTSIATGKTADKHGILNFVEPKPDASGLRVSASTSRKVKAIWNILSQSKLTTNVVSWYASHPAEPIQGAVVSNLLHEGEPQDALTPWPMLQGTVHPASMLDTIAQARQRAKAFPRTMLSQLVKSLRDVPANDAHLKTISKLMSVATSVEQATTAILRMDAQWDCTMAFFDAIDTMGHHFMQFAPPRMSHISEREAKQFGSVMDEVYEWHDASLGRLLAAVGNDTTVILASDHGFHSDHLRPNLDNLSPERRMELESSWHRPLGVLVMAGPGIRQGASVASPNILDLAPTMLTLLGVAMGDDFDGRVLAEAFEPPAHTARIASWEAVDGDAGLHGAEQRQDPFEAADAIQQLVDLGYMAALPTDVQAQLDLVRRESTFNLGVALMSRRRGFEAIPHFELLHQQRPHEARYALCLGNCLMGAGRSNDAAALMQTFCAHDPKNLDAKLLAAGALALTGNTDAARKMTDDIAKIAEAKPELALNVGNVMALSGRHTEANHLYAIALRRNVREPYAHIGLCRCSVAAGKFDDAIEHALTALELTQALPEAHYLLGVALAWSGDLVNAKASFGFALAHDSGNLDSVRFLALLAETQGERSDAHAHRNRAQVLNASVVDRPMETPHGPTDFALKHQLQPV